MRHEREIDVALVDFDKLPLNRSTFELCVFLEGGGDVPPIHVAQDGYGRFKIRDGRHRLLAHKLTGRTKIMARYGEHNRGDA